MQGGELELQQGWGWEQVPARGAAGTEGAYQEAPLEVRGAGHCREGGEAVAEAVGARGQGNLAGRQQEGSREAGGACRSPSEAVQNLG